MRRAGRHALTLQTQNRRMTAGDGKELDAAALRKMYKGYPTTLNALRAALDRGAGVQIGARRQGVLPLGHAGRVHALGGRDPAQRWQRGETPPALSGELCP